MPHLEKEIIVKARVAFRGREIIHAGGQAQSLAPGQLCLLAVVLSVRWPESQDPWEHPDPGILPRLGSKPGRQGRAGAGPEGARSYVNEFGEALALCPVPHL